MMHIYDATMMQLYTYETPMMQLHTYDNYPFNTITPLWHNYTPMMYLWCHSCAPMAQLHTCDTIMHYNDTPIITKLHAYDWPMIPVDTILHLWCPYKTPIMQLRT